MNNHASLPTRATPEAATSVEILPGERKLVLLGLALEMPRGCYGRIAPRSSFALRGIDVAGGVIDPDFRGEVKVILVNNGQESLSVRPGDRVGQLILEKYAKVNLQGAEDLTHTLRGGEGFGSTGVAVRSLSELRSERLHCRDRG